MIAKFTNKRWFRIFIWALLIAVLLPFTAESYLKIKGFESADVEQAQESFQRWYADPVRRSLGWDNDPQAVRYTLAVNSPLPPDYKRLGERRANYLVLGCSCTFGIAIEEEQGFVYLLRERYPKANFDNYAVPGFGTYQLYRKLQLIFERNHNLYDGIIYCNINDHLRRNTWLNLAQGRDGLRFIIPRVIPKSDGTYEYTDILPVPFWPGTRLFERSLWFAQTVYIREFSHKPFPRSIDVPAFNDILSKMNSLCRKNDTRLFVVWLDRDIAPELTPENRRDITCIDAVFQDIENPLYQVPGDGHPNAKVNEYWAEKIATGLKLGEL